MRVSVIIPAYHSGAHVCACLEALRAQTFREFETIVVDSTPDPATVTRVRRDHPEVRAVHSDRRLLPHAARNRGAQDAGGEILVFTDPDCTARSDWLERIVAAHDAGREVAGGAIACRPEPREVAIHMTKFAWWLPGGPPGPRPDLPTANVSYSRRLWERHGPFRGDLFAGDSDLAWRVRSAGHELWFEPRAVVVHEHRTHIGHAILERYARGRDFGVMRPRWRGWPTWRLAAYLILLPLVPGVVTLRSAWYALLARHGIAWLWTLPVHAAGNVAWSLGEGRSFLGEFARRLRSRGR